MPYFIPKRRMRLNNKKMAYYRKQQFYDAVFADLVLMGALPRNVVEDYFNAIIPPELVAPWEAPPEPFPTEPVTDLNMTSKVVKPVKNATPTLTFDTVQYTGTVAWWNVSDNKAMDTETFEGSTVYRADVSLIAKAGYTLEGLAGNDFLHSDATSVANTGSPGGIAITFPATAL